MSGGEVLPQVTTQRNKLKSRLEGELMRLKRISNFGYNLRVRWIPNEGSNLFGEVRGKIIYVYEEDEGKAIETLRHEFIDYCVSQAIEPYKEVTNRLIKMINEDAYRRKEKIVEGLTRLLTGKVDDSGHK